MFFAYLVSYKSRFLSSLELVYWVAAFRAACVVMELDIPKACTALLYGDGLGQVSGFVYVRAFYQRHMITEQLQRNGIDDRRYAFVYPRQGQVGDALAFIHLYSLTGKGDQLATTGADFLQVGFELFQQTVAGGDADHGHVFIYQCQGAVLEFTRRIGFGVDIGYLLELERPFHRDGVMGAAAQKQRMVLVGKGGGQLFDVLSQVQYFLDQTGQAFQCSDIGADHFRCSVVYLSQGGRQP